MTEQELYEWLTETATEDGWYVRDWPSTLYERADGALVLAVGCPPDQVLHLGAALGVAGGLEWIQTARMDGCGGDFVAFWPSIVWREEWKETLSDDDDD